MAHFPRNEWPAPSPAKDASTDLGERFRIAENHDLTSVLNGLKPTAPYLVFKLFASQQTLHILRMPLNNTTFDSSFGRKDFAQPQISLGVVMFARGLVVRHLKSLQQRRLSLC